MEPAVVEEAADGGAAEEGPRQEPKDAVPSELPTPSSDVPGEPGISTGPPLDPSVPENRCGTDAERYATMAYAFKNVH